MGGIHFAFDNTDGLTAGREIGSYIAANFLLPLQDPAHQGASAANQFFASSQSSSLATGVAMDWLAGLSNHAPRTGYKAPATLSAVSRQKGVVDPGVTVPTTAQTLLTPTSGHRLTSKPPALLRPSDADNFWEMTSDF